MRRRCTLPSTIRRERYGKVSKIAEAYKQKQPGGSPAVFVLRYEFLLAECVANLGEQDLFLARLRLFRRCLFLLLVDRVCRLHDAEDCECDEEEVQDILQECAVSKRDSLAAERVRDGQRERRDVDLAEKHTD